MPAAGLAEVDRFVFAPRSTAALPVLLLSAEQARPILADFFKALSPSKVVINDNGALIDLHKEIHKKIKYEAPIRKVGSYLQTIFNAASISETGFSMSLGGLLNHQNPCANGISLPKIILIHEDSIDILKLAAFFSLFKQIDPQVRPAVIFVCNSPIREVARKIATCGEGVNIALLSPSGIQTPNVSPEPIDSFSNYLSLFVAEANGGCLVTSVDDFAPETGERATVIRIIVDMLQIQSHFMAGRKFEPSQRVLDLQNQLQAVRESKPTSASDRELLGLKALLNIWEAYLFEARADVITNTISIADRIGDDLLLAHALKQSPLLHGYGNLTRQNLMRAKNIFLSHAETEQSIFTENNLVVNNMYTDQNGVEESVNLSNYVLEFAPYIRRSTTIHSNAGISCLINGQPERSLEYFDRAVKGSGPPVNRLTSEVNRAIARYLNGENIDRSEAESFLRKLERSNISPNFDYHQTEMLANMWRIFAYDKNVSREIIQYLKKKKFLEYTDQMETPEQLIRFAVRQARSVSKSYRGNILPGKLGHFLDQHNLLPAAHVFYR